MATLTNAPLVSPEEYIARFVEGDEKPMCEFVDGVLFAKSTGTKKHSQVQANITRLIGNEYDETLNPLPELTARLGDTQFYVPDVVVEELAKPIRSRYPGPKDPVFLCVEIVSPPDRVGKLFGKCEGISQVGRALLLGDRSGTQNRVGVFSERSRATKSGCNSHCRPHLPGFRRGVPARLIQRWIRAPRGPDQ